MDCKLILDANAAFRHADLFALKDIKQEDPLEVKAERHQLNFIRLDGNIGCMGNSFEP